MNTQLPISSDLDPSSPTPLYHQLSTIIKGCIDSGEYPHDTQIPTEAVLSQKYGVSRITVRKALEELTDEGLLIRKQGKGTFVYADSIIRNHYPFMPFKDSVEQSGKRASTKLLSYSLEAPNAKIADFLGLAANEQAIVIKRSRMADDTVVVLETDYFLPGFDFLASGPLNNSTSELLIQHNIHPLHGTNTISICYATEEEAALFEMDMDSPLLYVYSEIKDQDMRPIQVSKQIIRSSMYKLVLVG